ncbi:MAG: nicotinate-nucleotide adenylyltransferase [Lachnospiraceae bacterium]|nr:nicotinate-nucleotide adenylyltransferase [Lachnospiraceae bacterium]
MAEKKDREPAGREKSGKGEHNGRRIGIMGGTFDPIHIGHLLIAQAALEELSLDRVLFIPTGCSYLKEGRQIADREDRYRMTALAVGDHPQFAVSRMEIDRPGNTYTADTLRILHEEVPADTFYLLMGADSFCMLDQWREPETICKLATLVCAERSDEENTHADTPLVHPVRGRTPETQRDLLAERFGAKSVILSVGRMDVSSSDIRARIAAGKSVKYLLRDPVIDYIREHGLYRENS